MVKRYFILLLIGYLAALPAQARIVAELDRNRIAPGETVQLTLTLENNEAEPELEDLEANFEILQRRQVSRTQMINGRTSRQKQRVVVLAPKQSGTILIPPIRAGQEQSQALRLEVQSDPSAAVNKDAFLEVLLSRRQVYLRAELVVTIRAWYRGQVEGNLTSPAIEGALVEQLGEQQSGSQVRDGLRYTVVERRYLVFPQQPGTLQIPAFVLSGTQSLRTRSSILNPYGPPGGRRIHVRSSEQQVDVLPIPDQWPAGQPWLPARDLQLTEHWSQDLQQLAVGQAVTRSIRLRADGQSASALPPLSLQWPSQTRTYPDQPQLDQQVAASGVAGSRTESVALIPLQAGDLEFAPLEVYWWDTEADQLRTARIPQRTAIVAPAETGVSVPPTAPAPIDNEQNSQTVTDSTSTSGIWPWIAAVCLLGWLLTALGWAITRRGPTLKQAPDHIQEPVLRSLRAACRNNDPKAARQALTRWAQQQAGKRANGTVQLARTLGHAELERAVRDLDQALYRSGDAANWNGDSLWRAVQSATKQLSQSEAGQNSQDLPSLYPS